MLMERMSHIDNVNNFYVTGTACANLQLMDIFNLRYKTLRTSWKLEIHFLA